MPTYSSATPTGLVPTQQLRPVTDEELAAQPTQPASVRGHQGQQPPPVEGYHWEFHQPGPGDAGVGTWVAEPGATGGGVFGAIADGAKTFVGGTIENVTRGAGIVGDALGIGGSGPLPDISGLQGDARELYRRGLEGMDREYQAGIIRAERVANPGLAPSERVYAAPGVTAERVSAPSLGAAAQVERPLEMNAATATASAPGTTTIDQSQSNEMRQAATANLQNLQREAQGQGISAELARAQMARHLARISNDQIAAAGMARGAGRTGAIREAMLAQGRQGLEAALGVDEQALGRQLGFQQQLTGAIQGTRGQDIDVATAQANLDAQRRNLQAQLETAVSQGNSQEINRLRMGIAQLDQQAQQFNAGATNERTQVQGEMGLRAGISNADRSLTAGIDTARRTDAAALDSAARADTQAYRDSQQQIDVATGNADRGLTAQTAQETANRSAFDSTTGAQQAGAGAASSGLGAQTDALNAQRGIAKDEAEAKARDREFLLEGGAKLATLLSDERAKTGIEPVGDDELQRFADTLAKSMKHFKYKPGLGPEGDHVGPMAQDLEGAGGIGQSLVSQRPDGLKEIDQQSMTNLLLAAALRRKKAA
jgi:hypothetical protein